MIGSALAGSLQKQGHEVAGLVRPTTRVRRTSAETSGQQQAVSWDPEAGTLDQSAEGADAVVHLAGASIAEGRWTAARKRALLTHFGSPEAVVQASSEELQTVPGVPAKLGRELYQYLHRTG